MYYLAGVTVSGLIHLLLFSFLLLNWQAPSKIIYFQPKYIKAELVTLSPKLPAESVQRQQYDQLIPEEKRQDRERQNHNVEEQQILENKDKKVAAESGLKKKKLAELRKKERDSEEAQKKKLAEWESLLDREAQELAAREDEEVAKSYYQIIRQRLSDNWSRPPSARLGMTAKVRIILVPTGRVVGVVIESSSGDAAFDRSVEQAIRKVDQFVELQGMDDRLFELRFRQVTVLFSPEDLRL
tara:strand:+ start:641 stop:1363 length:723 start_codon:yes stop_codon:yes gene_type:complete